MDMQRLAEVIGSTKAAFGVLIDELEGCKGFDKAMTERNRDDALRILMKQAEQKFFVDENGKWTPLPIVTRCKDCEWRGNKKKCILAFVADKQEFPLFFYDQRGEWFCADGKPKGGDGDGNSNG